MQGTVKEPTQLPISHSGMAHRSHVVNAFYRRHTVRRPEPRARQEEAFEEQDWLLCEGSEISWDSMPRAYLRE